MGGSKSGASAAFTRQALGRSESAFNTGLPLLQKGIGMSTQAIALGGEPGYMGQAIEGATANAQDALMLQAQGAEAAGALGRKPTAAGGNVSQAISPESWGAKMAQIVANSGVARQNARIGNLLDAAGVGIGQATGAGQAQTQALGNQLGAISMRPAVDPTYATIVGAANAAGTIYGAANQSWGNGALQKPLPQGTSYASFPPTSGAGAGLIQPLPPARRF